MPTLTWAFFIPVCELLFYAFYDIVCKLSCLWLDAPLQSGLVRKGCVAIHVARHPFRTRKDTALGETMPIVHFFQTLWLLLECIGIVLLRVAPIVGVIAAGWIAVRVWTNHGPR